MSRGILLALSLLGYSLAHEDAQDWGGCVCGDTIRRMQEAWRNGLKVTQFRNSSREYATYIKAGVYGQGYVFMFEDQSTEMLIDRSMIQNKGLPIFDPASRRLSDDASDYGMLIQRAAEIHVVDSCFSMLAEVLGSVGAKAAVIHRFASRIVRSGRATCRQHEMFQLTSEMFSIQAVPLGAGNIDVEIIYPSENMVIESRDLQSATTLERAVQLSMQNFQVGAGDIRLLLKYTRYNHTEDAFYTISLLDSVLVPVIGAKCPHLQGRQMEMENGRCLIHSTAVLKDPGNFSTEIQIFSKGKRLHAHEVQFQVV
mmetsp:Transcript_7385/g.25277  ORF Transcript_7385/g.25277 Transcript_7385/m.25277 type:complete len:312 (-) Transcript_7385:137-1072(-)